MNLSHRVLTVIWVVWVLVTYAWAYLVKWSVTTTTFPSRPFPGFRHRQSRWTSSRGCVAMMFFREAFGCLALKARHGQHFPMCSFACAAMQGQKNLPCMRSSMCSRPKWPTLSWHPLRGTSPCVAGKTNWRRVSSNSLGLACLYKRPFLSTRWVHSCLYWLTSGESVALDWPFPSIPSLSLLIIRLRSCPLLGLDTSPQGSCWQSAYCPGICPEYAGHCCRPLWG